MQDQPPAFLVGLLGAGIGTSLTPLLHMEEARQQGLSYVYRVLDTQPDELDDAGLAHVLDAARLMAYDGLNVTFPYKQRVLDHLDEMDEVAARLGAVNTVLLAQGRRTGRNTDVTGFAAAMGHLPGADLRSVVQVGAGGAGAAVADALLDLGVQRLVVVDRAVERAESLAVALSERFGDAEIVAAPEHALAPAMRAASGIVHCTPTGMAHHPGIPFHPDLLRPEHWVADVVYRPLDTELLVAARARGCEVLHGGYMATYQAAHTFELVTGRQAQPTRMLEHLCALVAAPAQPPPESR